MVHHHKLLYHLISLNPATSYVYETKMDACTRHRLFPNSSIKVSLSETDDYGPPKSLACADVFHTKCIDKWLQTKSECPVCRKVVLPNELETNPHIHNGVQEPVRQNTGGTTTGGSRPFNAFPSENEEWEPHDDLLWEPHEYLLNEQSGQQTHGQNDQTASAVDLAKNIGVTTGRVLARGLTMLGNSLNDWLDGDENSQHGRSS
uniref:Zinc finger RING-H2-type domain-containing protein n=1 Tax=Globodera rostochiensis TaxID=31243 RepID=A0A914GUD2_GLORO